MTCKLAAPLLAGVLFLSGISLGAPRPAIAQDEYLGLPDEPGREEVAIYCGACHSLMLVVQQGLDRPEWDKLLDWMVEEQGMPELESDERKLVLDYLAEHVGPDGHAERLRDLRR
jgi:hypothetical protein